MRFRHGRADCGDAIAPWQRQAANAVHASIYVLLAAIPIIGYLAAATAPAQVPTFFLGFLRVPNVVGENLAWFPILRQSHRALANLLVLLGFAEAVAAVCVYRRGRISLISMGRGLQRGYVQAKRRPLK